MVDAEELSSNIKRYLVANTTDIRTDLNGAEVNDLNQYLDQAWEKADKQFNHKFIAIVGNRSYECLKKDLKGYKDYQFFNQNKT